jgi:hypothetical protein
MARVPVKVVAALAEGWRDIDRYPVRSNEGKLLHAECTVKALRKAGYKIVPKTKPPRSRP